MLRTALVLSVLTSACIADPNPQLEPGKDPYAKLRREMVAVQLAGRDIKDNAVLQVMLRVPRHLFVGAKWREFAYADHPLPIGEEQTISQPYIVAYMTQVLMLGGGEKVLEVGTGSGYQAAVLGEIVDEVYTIEILEPLAKQAAHRLQEMGYTNVTVRFGDGYRGWPEKAPFDAVIVTAAPDEVPQPLVDQLRVGGRMTIPVGRFEQDLLLLVKEPEGIREERVIPVRFVPMTGEAERR